ncbi:ribosomal L28e protein family-domain-containing protein [Elsinoe ampelina]|uniref:Protein MAK16 n=1 Tax=Elsinoe ampelina TaxID=302913 RepID=A0A6A6FZ90_9PEZI|nr:ribosomal L28e protein family-domain-containing protein [Elsinoe ampelina]
MSDSPEIIWSLLSQQFCAFKLKTTKDATFCRNEHNVSGLCNRQSCPLAQPRYATIRPDPDNDRLYLYIKEPERQHLPRQWWQRVKLSNNYAKALDQIDDQLIYWPKWMVHKCKQRLTRLTQVRVRSRKLAIENERLGEELVPRLAPKVKRREATRERKAEAAAKIERAIERELIERLKSGAYGDRPLNVDQNVWRRVMTRMEKEGDVARDKDLDEGIVEEEDGEREEEYETVGGEPDVEYVSDVDESDEEIEDFEDWLGGESGEDESGEDEEEDSEEDGSDTDAAKKAGAKRKRPAAPPKPSKKKSKKGPSTEIEYEYEREPEQRQAVLA